MAFEPTILVRPEPDGTVRIGHPPLGATEVAQVHLAGITVIVDPSDPLPATHALVYDPDVAAPVVEILFGTPAAEAVASHSDETVVCEPSPELDEVEKVGRLIWLEENRSVPVDAALLSLEAQIRHAQLPGSDPLPNDPDLVARLTVMARVVREDPTLPLAGQLRELFRLAVPHLPMNDPDFGELAHEYELLAAYDAWGSASLSSADLKWLAGQLTPLAASHLGETDQLSGFAALDWTRVPQALLPVSEPSVQFRIESGRVSVSLAPPLPSRSHPAILPDGRESPALVASLRSSTWPLPLAEGALTFDKATGSWRGTFPIVREAVELARLSPDLDVDVRSSTLAWRAPRPSAQRTAMARRWAARGVEGRRLASVTQRSDLDRAAVAALRFATRIWYSAGAPLQAERCQTLAAEDLIGVQIGLAEQWLLSAP